MWDEGRVLAPAYPQGTVIEQLLGSSGPKVVKFFQ